MRVWELDTSIGNLKTWKRVEYAMDRVDESVLVESGAVTDIHGKGDEGRRVIWHQISVFICFLFFLFAPTTFGLRNRNLRS